MVAELGQRLLQDLKGGKTRISPSRSVTHSVSCTLQGSPNNNNKNTRQQRTRCTGTSATHTCTSRQARTSGSSDPFAAEEFAADPMGKTAPGFVYATPGATNG